MALIKCPECGKDVSDKAKVCIHCGYPLAEYVSLINNTPTQNNSPVDSNVCPICKSSRKRLNPNDGKMRCAICGYLFQDLSADSLIQQANHNVTNATLPPIPFDRCPQCSAPKTKFVVDRTERAYVCGVCAFTVPFDSSVSDAAIQAARLADEERAIRLKQRFEREAAAQKKREEEANTVRCPKCGSTAITTGARGLNGMMGFWGASKTVNRCAKCGNTWKPKLR